LSQELAPKGYCIREATWLLISIGNEEISTEGYIRIVKGEDRSVGGMLGGTRPNRNLSLRHQAVICRECYSGSKPLGDWIIKFVLTMTQIISTLCNF
jgi:hypothetical protein